MLLVLFYIWHSLGVVASIGLLHIKKFFFSSLHSTTCDHCVALHLLTVHCPHAHTERKREREREGEAQKALYQLYSVFFFLFLVAWIIFHHRL